MKFCEAMDKLKTGSKVTRYPWKEHVYFVMEECAIKSMQPRLQPFFYSEDIIISDGWEIEGSDQNYSFCEIIPLLQQGKKAKLKEWDNIYIFLDEPNKMLVRHSMEVQPYIPDFGSFVAEDWIEL